MFENIIKSTKVFYRIKNKISFDYNLISRTSRSFKYIKRSPAMKYFIYIIPVIFLINGCNKFPDFTEKKISLTDTNDLTFSADQSKIFSERRNNLLAKELLFCDLTMAMTAAVMNTGRQITFIT
jgi:hypothetical protein